ncbi:MAG: inositol monophosphatase family protein [Pseudomonadota bacterium]
MEPMATIALRAARKAGDHMMRALDRLDRLTVEHKGRNDLVSEVDRDCEAMVVEALHQAYPDHAVIGEEQGVSNGPGVGPGGAEYTWIIDPLDGTTNYLHGIPHFAISIACLKGKQVEHGVIVDPLKNEEFVASRGKGAQLNGKRIRVRNRPTLEGTLIASGLPPAHVVNGVEAYSAVQNACMAQCGAMRRMGSAALDLAYVAAGRFDAFWEPGLKPWDIAAGVVLVREAGGFVGDLSGGDNFLEGGDIVAANPKLFKALVGITRPHARALRAANRPPDPVEGEHQAS